MFVLLLLSSFICGSVALGGMGPLLPDSQSLQQPGGLCLSEPVRCVLNGTQPSAQACADACASTSWCSSMTWAGPNVSGFELDCFFRFDGAFEAQACVPGCDQTSANKTSGWVPGPHPIPPPPQPRPSCATNGTACAPPPWAPEWRLWRSTIIQPWCRDPFTPAHPWGLISLAWDCSEDGFEEAATVANCTQLKSEGIVTRCFMYHNQELALEWLESQRAVMDDAHTAAGWFLRWPNGSIYTEPETSRPHGGFEAQAFWDFRLPAVSQYYVESVLNATASAAVDGSFSDDVTGVPAEHPLVAGRTGLSPADVAALQVATQASNAQLIAALVSVGKYDWQAFGAQDGTKGGPSPASCSAWMRGNCAPAAQRAPLLQQFDAANKNQSVASFLIVRPQNGYLGWGWYSNDDDWDPIFLLDAGEPTGMCVESPAGVFSRSWTEGIVALDCNTWVASLPFAYSEQYR